ncbi:hypothetical protein HRbin35_00331 [bacterium HR35]|nr:hypothetical protein HRbin35_00331 [bacterium HR35]
MVKKLLALFEVLFIHIKSNLDKIKISEDDYLLNLENFENLVAPNVGEENIGMILNILREKGGLPANINEIKWKEFLEYLEKAFENLFNSIKGFYADEELKNKVLETLNELMSQIDLYLECLPELLPFDQILIKDHSSPIIRNIREKYREFLKRIKKEAEDIKDMFEDEVFGYLRERIDEFQERINTKVKSGFNNSLEDIDKIIKLSERLIDNIKSNPEIIEKFINVFYSRICVIYFELFYYRIQVGNITRDLSKLSREVDTRRLKKKEKAQNLFDSLKKSFEIVLKKIEEIKKKINSLISEINRLENLSVEVPKYEKSLKEFLLKNFEDLIKSLDNVLDEIQNLFKVIESIKESISSK